MSKHTIEELQEMQALPLNLKIMLTKDRIRAWVKNYGIDGVYVSWSGGKDSTVLLDICRKMYPEIKAVYIDTGCLYLEYDAMRMRNPMGEHMRGHFNELKEYSQ